MTITAKKIIEVAYEMLDLTPEKMRGCYQELSNENYHAIKSHLSRSALMDYDKSPYTYWANHINPERPRKNSTPQMEFGTAFHTLILEPELFEKSYILPPMVEALPKVGLLRDLGREAFETQKQIREKQAALNAEIMGEFELKSLGKKILAIDDYNLLMAMKAKLESNEKAMQLIRDARIENSFFWQDEHSGMLLKARPDILHENMIVDLKTCSDASPRAYQAEMVRYGYHVQGAMIRDAVEAIEGRRINNVINICVETKYPHNMGIYIIDEFAIDEGQVKYKNILLDIKNAIGHNEYQDYGIQTIGLPKWAT
jgi:hypothetical protein